MNGSIGSSLAAWGSTLVGAALASTASAALLNPSFEYGTGNDFTGSDWTKFGFNAYRENVSPRTGDNSAKMYNAFTGSENYTGVYQDVPAAPGELWEAAVWVRHNTSDILGGGNQARLKIEFTDINWVSTGNMVETTILTSASPTDVYSHYTVQSVAPTYTAHARITLLFVGDANNSGGAAIFDDASLTVVPEPTAPALFALTTLVTLGRRRRK